jgi:hypothetical protein
MKIKPKKKQEKFTKKQGECFYCHRQIDGLNENYLKLITMNEGEIWEEVWFCLGKDGGCWSKFNDAKMSARLTEMSKVGFGILKNMGMAS